MLNWQDIGFKVENTSDNSPTLRILSTENMDFSAESMHHSGGAYSETNLIYGTPIKQTFKYIPRPFFISVGLGLGYVELVIAAESILAKKDFSLLTYESVPELITFFSEWLNDSSQISIDVKVVYDLILNHITQDLNIQKQLKDILKQKLVDKTWAINKQLSAENIVKVEANCVCYDAFSSKTNPELWDENFLDSFVYQSTQINCLFSTYASKGTLKRALKKNNFLVLNREGFMGKRNSTLAFRGIFTDLFPQSAERTQ